MRRSKRMEFTETGCKSVPLHFHMSLEESAVYRSGRNHPLTHGTLCKIKIERDIEDHKIINH